MNNLLKLPPLILASLVFSICAKAQDANNILQASPASMLVIEGEHEIEHPLNYLSIALPNDKDQLNICVKIPYRFIADSTETPQVSSGTDLLLNLKVDIDKNDIQENLTSSKIFSTHGLLMLNNTSKEVSVVYVPIASGTEEKGNFNIDLAVKFNGADFNITAPGSTTQFIIRVKNAKVNKE